MLAPLALLTAAYFLAGKFGLSLAVVHPSASSVWPPTGIALAALLMRGPRLWPAVFLGAFLVNVTTAGSVATALGIATGNTLEAVLGAALVQRFAGGRDAFYRVRNVFKFVVLAAVFSTTLSATIGVTTLTLAGFAEWRNYDAIWFAWWLGDAVGALVVTPLLMLWGPGRLPAWPPARLVESALLFAVVVAVGAFVFGGFVGQPLIFLCVPPLLWAAFRFGQREATAAVALLSALAIGGTWSGRGPLAEAPPHESLVLLQAFLGTMSVMGILTATVVAERKQYEAALMRLASIVESSDDAIVGKTLDGVITSWNAGAQRLYGYTPEEAIGRPISILIPPDRPNELVSILARIKRGEHIDPYETVRARKDGARVQVSVSVSPLRDASGKIIGASAIGRDLTAEQQAEAALREATALRSVASLAVAAAHEINNPLTVISGELQLLAREIGERREDRVASMLEALERIQDVVARLSRINRLEQAEPMKNLPAMLDLRKSSSD
jgi:PAS domain S-box-containing protein